MTPQEKDDAHLRSRLLFAPLLDHRYEAVETLMEEQGGKCALCDRAAVVLDHCHGTGLVRGMLCRSCNLVDVRSGSERAAAYFNNPPARGRWLYVQSTGTVLMHELGAITSHPHSRELAVRLLGPETT
jgi:hypothetical protein